MKIKPIFLSIFLFAAAFVSAQTPAQTVPNFTLYKLDNTAFTNVNLATNKMLFFFFFDPDCDHCQHAATNLNKQYADFKNAAVYVVSDNKEKILPFVNQYLPVFKNKPNVMVLQDPKDEFLTTFQPIRYPAMFLYGTNKKLVDYEDNAESTFRFKKPLQSASK